MTPAGARPSAGATIRQWLRLPATQVGLGLVAPALVMLVNMWRVRAFTIDDAYISFRYARNLVEGNGLVYNLGQAVEGYTNFSWTMLLAGAMALGIDPHTTAKTVGALSALGLLVVVYRMSARLQPLAGMPCVATWLLATSPASVCWAVFGLETPLFVLLILSGLACMFDEQDRGGFPRSGLVFALAGLTRPEAPMFVGIAMLLLGRRMFARQNLLRGLLFGVPLIVHLLWRHHYYGAWVPATLAAKTGDIWAQLRAGTDYVARWADDAGPLVLLWTYLVGLAVVRRSRKLATLAALFAAVTTYVVVVGGDWMAYHRFMVVAEPFAFLAACIGLRHIASHRDRATIIAIAGIVAFTAVTRPLALARARQEFLGREREFWDFAAGGVAEWLLAEGRPGRVALGDIGFVGWATNYPILDLLGLVDPTIAALEGGYTAKTGQGYVEHFFAEQAEYAVLIHSGHDCKRAVMPGVRRIVEDVRFARTYKLGLNHRLDPDGSWCVFVRRDFAAAGALR